MPDGQHHLPPVDVTEFPLRVALDRAEPKPEPRAAQGDKRNYAQRLSNALAQEIANALRSKWPTVTPRADGRGQEAQVGVAAGGMKRLDVKVTNPTLGLVLSVSIKTYSFEDYSVRSDKLLGRYTKNVVRNDHELRGEASVLHQRQPYSVVVGVMFAPIETAIMGAKKKSSLAHMVNTFRKRSGRGRRPVFGVEGDAYVHLGGDDPRYDRCERMFVGVYEWEGERRGHVRFIDVEKPFPQVGVPSEAQTLSFDEFIARIKTEVDQRDEVSPTLADIDDEVDE